MADNIKISALTELVSGSITGTTIVPLVDGGVTLKAQMSSLKAFTNSDVATDTELANQIAAVNNTINALSTDNISEGTAQYYTDTKVKTKLNADGVLSGSFPAGYNLGVIGGGTSVSTVDSITVYGATVTDNGSGDIALSIDSGSQLNLQVSDGSTTVTDVDSISVTGGTVTNNGSGDVTIAIPVADVYSLTVSDERLESIADVTQIKLVGAIVDDSGSGIIQVTVDGTDVSLLNTFTGSINSRVNALEIAEGVSELNIFTGSFSSSMEGRVTTLEAGGGGSTEGTISGSQQITDFGFTSSSLEILQSGTSIEADVKSINFTGTGVSTTDGAVTISVAAGGGGSDGDVEYNDDYHIVSQSVLDPTTTNLALAQIKIGTGANNFTFTAFSQSLNNRFGGGGGADFINDVSIQNGVITFAGTGNAFSSDVPLPTGTISGSTQLSELGYVLSGDINEVYIKDRLPQNLLSSSIQIINNGFVTTDSTASFADKDAITGSFSLLSASLSDRIGNEGSGITEVRLGEVTASMLNGGSVDGNDNVVTLVSSSQQITYSGVTDTPYFIGDGVTITSGSDVSNIPYFNLSAGSDSYILAHTASLNYHSASISASVDALIVDSGSFSQRVTAVEVSSGTARFEGLEARTGSIDNSVNELNTFTGSFSSSVAQRIDNVEGAGGGADYISNVVWAEPNLVFTGQGSGFNGNVNIASVSGSGLQVSTFTPFSASIAGRIDSIGAGGGASTLEELTDVGDMTVDIADGDILTWVAAEQEFTHSKALTGDYQITGSVDTKGSMNVSGSVTADSFIAGDVGTPTISAAADLEINAGNSITLTSGINGTFLSSSAEIRIQNLLTIDKTIGESLTTPLTGSIMNSGSVIGDSKLWFFNGTEWKEIAFV